MLLDYFLFSLHIREYYEHLPLVSATSYISFVFDVSDLHRSTKTLDGQSL